MWRRPVGCLKLQVIFRRRATNYWALLRKMTFTDKASYGSLSPCTTCLGTHIQCVWVYTLQNQNDTSLCQTKSNSEICAWSTSEPLPVPYIPAPTTLHPHPPAKAANALVYYTKPNIPLPHPPTPSKTHTHPYRSVKRPGVLTPSLNILLTPHFIYNPPPTKNTHKYAHRSGK